MGASAGSVLDPGGEGLPGVGVAQLPGRGCGGEGETRGCPRTWRDGFCEWRKDRKRSAVGGSFGCPLRGVEAPPGSVNGPARNRRVENGDGGEDDQPFVSSRIGAILPSEKNQRDEGQDAESGNGKEGKHIGPPGVTDHFVDSCENRKNGHGAGESEAEHAEAAMKVHAVRGDQLRLPDENTNPAGKARAVNVNQTIADRSLENAGKVIVRE